MFEILRDNEGYYYFEFETGDGESVATSRPYSSREAAMKGIELIRHSAETARLVERTESTQADDA
jgi:uncharacterized protein YegP (UPF0339 family)